MKILTKFIFVFITIISFTGCKKDLTQVIEEFYPDGNPKIVYYLDKNNNKVKVEAVSYTHLDVYKRQV